MSDSVLDFLLDLVQSIPPVSWVTGTLAVICFVTVYYISNNLSKKVIEKPYYLIPMLVGFILTGVAIYTFFKQKK